MSVLHRALFLAFTALAACDPPEPPSAAAAADLARGGAVDYSLHIGTFNTFLISPGMRCISAGSLLIDQAAVADCLLINEDLSAEDADDVAASILADPFRYDVIALNEVFDEDARQILVGALAPTFPFFVSKVDDVTFDFEGILEFNPEDSGLMLFSRFRIAPLPDPSMAHPDVEGSTNQVAFRRFEACSMMVEDCLASKGAAFVRIQHPSGAIYNVVFTHLNADSAYAETRKQQLFEVQSLIDDVLAPIPNALEREELFVMGDLNIDGFGGVLDPGAVAGSGEWLDRFGTTGEYFTDQLRDAWARTTSEDDRGVSYRFADERLDYILLNSFRQQAPVQNDYACVQHLTLGNHGGSDHTAVRAAYNRYTDHCNPRLAYAQPQEDVTLPGLDIAFPRGMQWFEVDPGDPATYSIKVSPAYDPATGLGVKVDVYDPTDLTTPIDNYLGEVSRNGPKYKVNGRFYARVYSPNPTWTGSYTIRFHRHRCINADDACILTPWEWMYFNDFKAGIPLGGTDSAWFQVDVVETATTGAPQSLEIFAQDVPTPQVKVDLLNKQSPYAVSTVAPVVTTGGPLYRHAATFEHPGPVSFYLRVTRTNPALLVPLSVGWTTNLMMYHGQHGGLGGPDAAELELTCIDETNGFLESEAGDDEIHLMYNVDGSGWYQADGFDFDCNNQRQYHSIEHTGPIGFLSSLDVKLIEGDGFINPDDDGPTTQILPADPGPSWYVDFSFEGGEYELTYNKSWMLNHGAP